MIEDDIKALRESLPVITQGHREQWQNVCSPERISRLMKALEEAQKDAERYRFIKDTPWDFALEQIIETHQNARWDSAIDAAMQKKGERDVSLPELPEPAGVVIVGTQAMRAFTADQMLAYGKACRDAALEEAAQKCIDIREDESLAKAKPYEDTHGDGWLDGCNECEWAIRALRNKQ